MKKHGWIIACAMLSIVLFVALQQMSLWKNRYILEHDTYDDMLCTRGKRCDDLVFEAGSDVLVVRQVRLDGSLHFVVWSESGATDGFESRCKTRAESLRFVKQYFDRCRITSSQREIIRMIGEPVDHDLVIDYHGPRRQWQKDFIAEKYNPYVDDDIIKIRGRYYRMLSVCSVESMADMEYLTPPIVTRVKGPMSTPEKAAAQGYFRNLSQDEAWWGRHSLGDL